MPDLNPDEQVWGWTKYGYLSNLAAWDADELRDRSSTPWSTSSFNTDCCKPSFAMPGSLWPHRMSLSMRDSVNLYPLPQPPGPFSAPPRK